MEFGWQLDAEDAHGRVVLYSVAERNSRIHHLFQLLNVTFVESESPYRTGVHLRYERPYGAGSVSRTSLALCRSRDTAGTQPMPLRVICHNMVGVWPTRDEERNATDA